MTGSRTNCPLLTTLSNVKQAPKWSFRGRGDPASMETPAKNPGPGAYGVTQPDKSKYTRAPAATFGTSSRDGPRSAACPGPGQYATRQTECTPKYGFGTSQRAGMGNRSQTPGPGAYDVRGDACRGQVSLGARFSDASRRARTPGPGSYNSTTTYDHGPRFGFGTSLRPDLQVPTKNPGPGAYQAMSSLGGNVVFSSPPRYSMKARRDENKGSCSSPSHGGQFTTFGY